MSPEQRDRTGAYGHGDGDRCRRSQDKAHAPAAVCARHGPGRGAPAAASADDDRADHARVQETVVRVHAWGVERLAVPRAFRDLLEAAPLAFAPVTVWDALSWLNHVTVAPSSIRMIVGTKQLAVMMTASNASSVTGWPRHAPPADAVRPVGHAAAAASSTATLNEVIA